MCNRATNTPEARSGWAMLDRLGRARWPALLRGDAESGNEPVMARAERQGLPYLFRLRATINVKRTLERAMAEHDWMGRPVSPRNATQKALSSPDPANGVDEFTNLLPL